MRYTAPNLRHQIARLLALGAACAQVACASGPQRPAAMVPAPTPVAATAAAPSPQFERISVPGPAGVTLTAYWLPAAGEGAHPAVLALHGCGGLYAKGGALSQRFREAAARLHAQGYAVLLPDSFGSRGLHQVCQTRYAERSMHVAERAHDARAALAWLAAQPQVDAQRLGLLGWSNGASTVLAVLEQRRVQPAPGEPPIAGAAVFYPGCGPLERRQATLERVPLLMQLGALDDWTPPQPCIALAQRLQAQGADVSLHVYAGSYHGFDGAGPVRLRTDVPNGPAGGVHQGGNPEARVQSLAALDMFWSGVLRPRERP
ncbi:Dienelactone hydrolase [Oryzisolibacter propanilivorax]|uniref:Dienelactone hydrolase n=1 Tax=Oryzisolibacter propanilivorax TaxID=1527607 RepID=A0A1G9VJL2_9BURK|nr:dienelactone hydrolase family protein [Oryzisolibacter propanilivorax]SDM72349.1 Dienelactone hydrolase [Oryzisolibacter propanilivorax]